jgi:hypothetical protein
MTNHSEYEKKLIMAKTKKAKLNPPKFSLAEISFWGWNK